MANHKAHEPGISQAVRAGRAHEIGPGFPRSVPAIWFRQREAHAAAARVIAVGDLCFGGMARSGAGLPGSAGLIDAFEPALSGGDLVFGNYEGVLADHAPEKAFFAAPVSEADFLSRCHFNVIHMANNHALDCGREGLASTVTALQARDVTVLGAGKSPDKARELLRTDVGDLRIGLMAAGRTGLKQNAGQWAIHELDEEDLVKTAGQSSVDLDCLIVSLHTGFMFVEYPHPRTRRLAQRLTEAGACLVLIHHSHVLQGVEVTPNGGLICYSLGNFLFDWRAGNIRSMIVEDRQREGGIFCFELDRFGVASAALVPTVMDDRCAARWPDAKRAGRILKRVIRLSEDIVSGDCERRFWEQRAERNTGHAVKMLWFLLRSGRLADFVLEIRKVRWHHFRMLAGWFRRGMGIPR